MKSRFFLNVIVRKGSSIFQLFSSKDKSLLIWWNSFFILNFSFYSINGVTWFNIKSNGFSCQCLNKDLHSSSKSQDEMKCRFFLNVIVRKSSSIFQLFSSENKSLLIWWNSFFILNFSFDSINGITWFNIKSDGFSG